MSTDKYPNRNVSVPYSRAQLDEARSHLGTSHPATMPSGPASGDGSKRQVRQGEWVDDRRIVIGGPSSPSEDSPPDLPGVREVPPATYDPLKVYEIKLGKGIVFSGRMLSPGKTYQMVGAACTEISAAVIDAVVIGDIPADPDVTPSTAPATKHKFKG
jgi:hypothetical protein